MTTPKYGSWSDAPNGMVTQVIPTDTRGPKRLWNAPAGYTTRHRGAPIARAMYMCPVHGAFEDAAGADRAECPAATESVATNVDTGESVRMSCGLPSPWSPSAFAVWASSGEVKS